MILTFAGHGEAAELPAMLPSLMFRIFLILVFPGWGEWGKGGGVQGTGGSVLY